MGDVNGALVVSFAQGKANTKVGSGECFDLADLALKSLGAKSAEDYGVVTPDADYVWGNSISMASAGPGDILQYRDYVRTRTEDVETTLTFADGGSATFSETSTAEISRPHHTAVVIAAPSAGTIKIAEQNVDRGSGLEKLVKPDTIYYESQNPVTTETTKTGLVDVKLTAKLREIDPEMAKKYANQSVKITTKTTITIDVGGTLKAYRPQTK